jgi:uncharacterized protein (DUF58 family)
MDTKELLKKVRKIEIKTRRLSDHIFSGEYHTSFKGRGMTFSEVRQYQFGDDVRAIDWNVTARYNEPYIKVFEEERELTMILMVDVSGSESFGTQKLKSEIVTEIAATMAFSATQNNDKIGLILFSDQIELYIPPKKGKSHVLRIIRELIEFKPKSRKTDLSQALKFLSGTQKKKAIVFMISDFMANDDYEQTLKIASKKHDITGIRVFDHREEKMPNLGMVHMLDAETGETLLVNTGSKSARMNYEKQYSDKIQYFKETFSKCGSGVVNTRVDESYVTKLLGYFKSRG